MKITVIALDHPDYGLTTYATTNERSALLWLRAYYESEHGSWTLEDVESADLLAAVTHPEVGYRVTIEEHDVEVPLYPEKPRSLQTWPPRRGVA